MSKKGVRKLRTRDSIHDCAIHTLQEMSVILQTLQLELDAAECETGTVRPERISALGDELRINHEFLLSLTNRPIGTDSPLIGMN
jgi:hypothetical protein